MACRNLANSKVELITGTARFNVDGKVEVDGVEVRAKKVLLAVGGKPLIPNIPGMNVQVLGWCVVVRWLLICLLQ